MHGCLQTVAGSPRCPVNPPSGRLKNSALCWFDSPLCFSRAPSDFRRPRARGSVDCGRCMQNGAPEQSDLVRFIAEEHKPQLVSLLLHAGERLPLGDDSAADHRAVLFTYLQRAPGHLLLALESFRAGDDVDEGVLLGDSARESRLDDTCATSALFCWGSISPPSQRSCSGESLGHRP